MRQVIGAHLGDFATIYDESVEVVSVARRQSRACETLGKRLIRSVPFLRLRWIQSSNDPDSLASQLPTSIEADIRDALHDEIAEASDMLGELMGCEQIGVRLESMNSPMCPRFHADQVPCRMLITLSGLGTEWIPNSDVDWAVFCDLNTMAPPILPNRQIQQLSSGYWSVLKGGAWHDGFGGVVHRSPHGTGQRLLLTLDPIY